MFGLSHFFIPGDFSCRAWRLCTSSGGGRRNYWFYVIFFLGPPGAAIYILAEVLPDLGLLRGFFQGFGRRSRVQVVETMILDNPSPANYEELGELYKIWGSLRRRARHSRMRSMRGALLRIRFIHERNARWD